VYVWLVAHREKCISIGNLLRILRGNLPKCRYFPPLIDPFPKP
jgi:hypothetical protein